MDVLIIGGSGFVSGTLARRARAAGHRVWALTRGRRPLPAGVTPLVADRAVDAAFAAVVRGAGVRWDLAVDCVGFNPHDAAQDLRDVAPLAGHLTFISTDFVYDPLVRAPGQGEDAASYNREGYGGEKRAAERVLETSDSRAWTILRPCHIYGPGSELGCLPAHSRDPRLLETIAAREPLRLVAGGRLLQQPLFAADLADVVLDLAGRSSAAGRIFNVRGPDTVESRHYYELIGEALGSGGRRRGDPARDLCPREPGQGIVSFAPRVQHRPAGGDRRLPAGHAPGPGAARARGRPARERVGREGRVVDRRRRAPPCKQAPPRLTQRQVLRATSTWNLRPQSANFCPKTERKACGGGVDSSSAKPPWASSSSLVCR